MSESETEDYELDVELCKLIEKLPLFTDEDNEVCEGIDTSDDLHPEFYSIVSYITFMIFFLLFLIIYFFFLEVPINKLAPHDWGDSFNVGDFYRPIENGKYVCYQPTTELVDIPINNVYNYPIPPPPPPPTINFGPGLT